MTNAERKKKLQAEYRQVVQVISQANVQLHRIEGAIMLIDEQVAAEKEAKKAAKSTKTVGAGKSKTAKK